MIQLDFAMFDAADTDLEQLLERALADSANAPEDEDAEEPQPESTNP